MYELGKIRTFLSLNTEVSIRPGMAEIQKEVMEQLAGYKVRWEDPERFHLTLRFLGDIDEEKVPDLKTVLGRLKFDFEDIVFSVRGIGFFPDSKYPNVVYLDLDEKGDNTEKLVGFIDRIIFNFGVKPDKKFVPHITIGRFKKDKRIKLEKNVAAAFQPFSIRFDSFYLMQSLLQKEGSKHLALSEFRFNA